MTARPQPGATERAANDEAPVCYVYGIVPSDARVPEGLTGIGGGEVTLVRHAGLAGVVGEIPPTKPLGTRDDLLAHDNVVSSLAAGTTMLPMRFGAAVTTKDAVVDELLAPYHEWFATALADMRGKQEYVVTGTYVEDVVLREVLDEEPEVALLRKSLQEVPEDAAYQSRIQMGELIVRALERKRVADTEALVDALAPHATAVIERPPAEEDTAANVAFLVLDRERPRFEEAVRDLTERWAGRIGVRLLGPLAPYDFVMSLPEET